ncbi:hypothetical protein J23TS9_42790 [Paenibacillus sp. J23TS9]|uniref:hypothetical protein n=1 Tax=Paenibacillus sp. J23TS9 TaxID=2807193 RepID=UPI001AFF6F73|nr:hypothetical protein [Paenibacillus sp. J23TS9]GIP29149.1 hypothetical protein J23TS9_42790 [Paenibacillus sp. J23TS9]
MIVLNDSDTMRKYLRGVLARAGHHAPNVEACVIALFGGVIAYKDKGTDLEVKEHEGDMKNVLWTQIKGKRYAFTYNHDKQCIDMRENSTHGPARESFDDTWTLSRIRALFSSL